MRWRDDGTRPLWHCTACDASKPDVIGLRPGHAFHVRFTYEKRGWHFGYVFEGGYVDDMRTIAEPRCVLCHKVAEFVWQKCATHEVYQYLASEDMAGKQYAVRRCRRCDATLRVVEVTTADWHRFVKKLLKIHKGAA